MKRRTKIRVISFITALITVLCVWGIIGTVQMKKYKTLVNISQQRALTGISEALDETDTALTKMQYTVSPELMNTLLEELTRSVTAAKINLSTLNTGDTQLYSIYKFLSHAGDYTGALQKKAQAGLEITKEERENLQKLLTYNTSLLRQFGFMNELMDAGQLTFDEIKKNLPAQSPEDTGAVSFLSSVSDAEDSMGDYPTLVYDGPFSDELFTRESALLKNSKKVSEQTARKTAAKALDTGAGELTQTGEREGRLPCYTYRYQNTDVAVTKNGGYLLSLLTEKTVGTQKLTGSDAVETASAFLYKNGYPDMRSTYYAVYDGVCTVNFAYTRNGVICYPDLIKVGVDLSNGDIVSMEASDYIMNHKNRTTEESPITVEQASKAVTGELTVKKAYRAVIPKKDGTEKDTVELLCEGKNGQDVLLYVNAKTGKEEDILLLLYGDNGTLTK